MIDAAGIETKYLGMFSGMYLHVKFHFKADITELSKYKRKKIRKWLCRQYADTIRELPQALGDIFMQKNSDSELLIFLKTCYEQMETQENTKRQKFEKNLRNFNRDVRSAFSQLRELGYWPYAVQIDDDVQILIDDTPAYRKKLILKNAEGIPVHKQGCYIRNLQVGFSEMDSRYCLHGEWEDQMEGVSGSSETISLTFDSAEVAVQVFNPCESMAFWENPWSYLSGLCFSIEEKADLPGHCCNAMEEELLPFIKEIVTLVYWMDLPEQGYLSFSQMKSRAEQYGYKKLISRLEKLEILKPGDNRYYSVSEKLVTHLCLQKYEGMWRDIFFKVKASQTGYPNKAEAVCHELIHKKRAEIQKSMESYGYTGTYPDFVKYGALKGLCLEKTYGTAYITGMKKRLQYRIHCVESPEEDHLTIQFLCGTAFLRKDEEPEDIYNCLFNAKGRRLFHTVHHIIPLGQNDNMEHYDDTEQCDLKMDVTIAVKKAECVRLNKDERKYLQRL